MIIKFISSSLGWLFGWPMWAIYQITGNYGVSIIVFTILMRFFISLFKINTIRNQSINRYVQQREKEIKKEFINDRKKMEEELLKLYNNYKTSPLSRIVPTVIQISMIYGLLNVFYNPLKHILRLPAETIKTLIETASKVLENSFNSSIAQLSVIEAVSKFPESFTDTGASVIANFNMDFLGINLCSVPEWGFNITMLFPLLVFATTFIPILISIIISIKNITNKKSIKKIVLRAGLSLFFGVLLIMFSLSMPIAMSLYWIVSSIASLIASYILKKIVKEKPLIINENQCSNEKEGA